ncbi:ATP-binding protein [Pelodictyon luteolum]|uniref:histidine kinase n=1 Tax=Chlorobium luteolum (strain DSM 273 / BCRC 81028 / 2530) TaxID=319225 RepID=Q3B600_CHLL3|nr:ATP-binding protein [Pelodictyon luteolum]ABB23231.1 multi-sensor signal transduction histidine kinase [Pelodictyon luteolum DSM 273]
MSRIKQFRQRLFLLHPASLGGIFFLLFIVFLTSTLFEYRYRRLEIEHMMEEEASLLIHALTVGAENAVEGYNGNRTILTGSLLGRLRLLDRLDRQKPLTSRALKDIAGRGGMYRINVFDRTGRRIAWNVPPDHAPSLHHRDPKRELEPILSGRVDSLVLGIRQSVSDRGPRLIAAVARSRGGAIVGNVDASELLELRRSIGAGSLIRKIGAGEAGIDYIIWQDTTAILAATPNVSGADPLLADPVLAAALRARKPTTRMTEFDGRPVFEVVNPFYYRGANVGLLRVGLRTDHFNAAFAKLRNRFFMMLGLLFFGGLALFNLVITRRDRALAAGAYQRVSTFSSSMLTSMADAVLSVNGAGALTLLNAAGERLFGVRADDVLGRSAASLSLELASLFAEAASGEFSVMKREFRCRAGGREHVLEGSFSRISEGQGGAEDWQGTVVVLRDLTEHHAMQERLERQGKLTAMGELASGVAHEIRNPLNAIGLIAQRLDIEFTPKEDEAEFRHLLRTVVSEVHRLNAIIQRFLRFARPPALEVVPTDLAAFAADYRAVLEGEASDKGVAFSLSGAPGTVALIDRDQMQQVLLNIVRNAVEATSRGGAVSVSVSADAGSAVIEVADTGKGTTPDERHRMFNLYFTTKDDGTGMGLSIASQIVQSHGGTIEVNDRPGGGTVFRILVPQAPPSGGDS